MSSHVLRLRPVEFTPVDIAVDDLITSENLVDALIETGIVVVRSPFVGADANHAYLDMLTPYFGRSKEVLARDVRPDVKRQVGLTESGGEAFHRTKFFRNQQGVRSLVGDRAPYPWDAGNLHMRFMWRYGERPLDPIFAESHADPVVPEGIPEWEATMNDWGRRMVDTGTLVMRHIERGLGLSGNPLTEMLRFGPHLVAPTATELNGLPLGTVTADVHTDFNPLTLHGSSRYPTLVCWTKAGTPFLVRVPPGCILVQAGKQLEWMTGGTIMAGYHQTVVMPETVQALIHAPRDASTIRVSSTVFLHFNWELPLQVLPELCYHGVEEIYPQKLSGEQAIETILAIDLDQELQT